MGENDFYLEVASKKNTRFVEICPKKRTQAPNAQNWPWYIYIYIYIYIYLLYIYIYIYLTWYIFDITRVLNV